MKKLQTPSTLRNPRLLPRRVQNKFDSFHGTIKKIGEIVTSIVIIASFVSISLGTIVLSFYLSNYSFLASPTDLFNPTILMFFMVCFVWTLFSILIFALAPFAVVFMAAPDARQNLPLLFGNRFVVSPPIRVSLTLRARIQRLKRQGLTFTKEYFSFYIPAILLALAAPIVTYFHLSQRTVNVLILYILLGTFFIGIIVLYLHRLRRRFGWSETYSLFFIANFVSVLWMTFVAWGVYKALVWGIGTDFSFYPILVTLITLSMHYILSYVRFSIPSLVGCAVLVGCGLAVFPGYSEIGALALREAHLGGGIPISYEVLNDESPEGRQPTLGCLILATPNYLLLSDRVNKSCPTLRRFAFASIATKPQDLSALPRNQVKIVSRPNTP